MTLLFSLLSLFALFGAIGLVVMLARSSSRKTAVQEFGTYALGLAATVASVATLGSLYLSEIEGFVPCRLCWAQRGLMYPLAVFLIVAAVRRWAWASALGLGLSVMGVAVAFYHYAEQKAWIGGSEGFCDASAPCTDIWVNHFGFISIPFMSFTGFLFVGALMWLHIATLRTVENK